MSERLEHWVASDLARETRVPSWRLAQEAEKRRTLEARVAWLELAPPTVDQKGAGCCSSNIQAHHNH